MVQSVAYRIDGRWMRARHWSDAAGRPPVVLVHGLGMSGRYMVRAAEILAETSTVWAPDLPGFGLSDKPPHVLNVAELAEALNAFCEASAVPAATFVGHSLGCQVVLELQRRWPGRVRAMVLAAPTVDPAGRTSLRQIGRLLADVPREPLSLGPLVVSEYLRAGLPRVVRTLRFMMQDPIETKLPRVDVPTLVLQGERDGVVPPMWSEAVVRLLPRGRYAVIAGGAHGMNYSQPAAFARAVAEFMCVV